MGGFSGWTKPRYNGEKVKDEARKRVVVWWGFSGREPWELQLEGGLGPGDISLRSFVF